jgi:hypothetical protein
LISFFGCPINWLSAKPHAHPGLRPLRPLSPQSPATQPQSLATRLSSNPTIEAHCARRLQLQLILMLSRRQASRRQVMHQRDDVHIGSHERVEDSRLLRGGRMVRLDAERGECVWQFRVKRGWIIFRAQRSDMRKANQCFKDGRRNDSFLKVVRMVHKLTCKS